MDREQFANEWYERIGSQLRKLGVPSALIPDRTQDVFLKIFATNHLEKFDADKGGLPNHIWQVSRSVAYNGYKYRATRGSPIDKASSLQNNVPEEFEMGEIRGIKILEMMDSTPKVYDDPDERIEALQTMTLAKHLLEKPGVLWSKKTQEHARNAFGSAVQNSLWQVAYWVFIEGLEVEEIAFALNVSDGSVKNWITRVKAQVKMAA